MILAYLEIADGEVKKSSYEVAQMSSALALKMGIEVMGIAFGKADTSKLEVIGNYGVSKVVFVNTETTINYNLAEIVVEIANKYKISTLIFPKSLMADAIAAKVSIKMNAAIINNVSEMPEVGTNFIVKRSIYTGKAFAKVSLNSPKKVISLRKNAIKLTPTSQKASIENYSGFVSSNTIKIKETSKATGDILLTDAEIVVSGGRGLKGPENWHLIENLAKALGAATGCSKPVSDMDWRPHHEHVGQTGVKVAPNIYFAVGISGAIQHLAGVNSSKVLVAINTDPEAPFFKAADYGIIGDAFDILPKLTEAAKKIK